jgi:hypothetical protein
MWSRPLITVDGAPPDTLTKAQFHAMAGIFDRDGRGVKYSLLTRCLLASENDYRAIERLRSAIAANQRDTNVSRALNPRNQFLVQTSTMAHAQRTWYDSLRAVAEASQRPGLRLIPREVYDALSSASLLGGKISTDLATVEDAVLCLLGDSESSVAVEDLIDVLAPVSSSANIALLKSRRFMGTVATKRGANHVHSSMAASAVAASNAMTGETPSAGRMTRSTLAAVFREFGMLIVEDSMPRAFSSFVAPQATIQSGGEEELRPTPSYTSTQRPMYSSFVDQRPAPAAAPKPAQQPADPSRINPSTFAFELLTAADRLMINQSSAKEAPVPAPAPVQAPAPVPVVEKPAPQEPAEPAPKPHRKPKVLKKTESEEAPVEPPFSLVCSPATGPVPSAIVIEASSVVRMQPTLAKMLQSHAVANAKQFPHAFQVKDADMGVYLSYQFPADNVDIVECFGPVRTGDSTPITVTLFAPLSSDRAPPRTFSLQVHPSPATSRHQKVWCHYELSPPPRGRCVSGCEGLCTRTHTLPAQGTGAGRSP